MRIDIVLLFTCFIIGIVCTSLPCDECRTQNNNVRIKRAKYYSSPPQRYYRRPPMSPHGAFSYTPPPNYMMDEDEQALNHRPSRHSRPLSMPVNDGLGDEDIYNLIKYLSKKDLDKIVEYAVEKDKYRDTHVEKPIYSKPEYNNNVPPENPIHYKPEYNNNKPPAKTTYSKPEYNNNIPPETPIYSKPEYNSDTPPEVEHGQRYLINGPYANPDFSYKQSPITYPQSTGSQISESNPIRVSEDNYQPGPNILHFDAPLDTEESMRSQQFAVVDAYIKQEINGIGGQKGLSIFTDGKDMKEEQLPAPLNLRQDYDASFTNNIPAVVKADSNMYKIENFGNLPLMNYNSKLDSVSSYKVPHYTVTSPNQYQPALEPPKQSPLSPPAGASNPPLELAPTITNYRDQSDAHLKATKIWTHKSKGTAYYLHPDGSLSLERPNRPKPKYG